LKTYFYVVGAFGVFLPNFRVRKEARTLLVLDHDGSPLGERDALCDALNSLERELYDDIRPELTEGIESLNVSLFNLYQEATWLYLSIVPSTAN
jgi:hypothetical protein